MLENQRQSQSTERLVSIDALRGFTMLWIIGGSTVIIKLAGLCPTHLTRILQHQMEHSEWAGFTFLDLIFPLFLFIVGMTLTLSISRHLEKGENPRKLYLRIAKRTSVLITLGLFNYGLLRFDWPNMRWSSVLGRIGICYFFASLLLLNTGWQTQAMIAAAILILYWAALTLIPVPDFGPNNLTPQGCLTTYLDQLLIPGKLGLQIYDRQGILSTFTALATTLIGVLAGHWMRSRQSVNRKMTGLLCAALLCLALGYAWGKSFLISRNIWTSSFVLVAAGWSLLLFVLFYWIIDIKKYKRWAFVFVVIGMNAIAIWFGKGVIPFDEIASYFLLGVAKCTGPYQPLVLVSGTLLVEWLFLWFLYRHKIFFKA